MSKARVLVVDDEDTIRKLLKSRLDREGFDVVVAANADEAQGAIEKGGQVAVMITDLKMPGRDGFSLMAWARESRSDHRSRRKRCRCSSVASRSR